MKLRPAVDADGPAVRDLVFAILEEYGLVPDPAGIDADLVRLEESYAQKGGMFDLLVDPAGGICGCVGLYPIDPTTCELRRMYLRRDLRGRGLGRRLLRHALGRARRSRFRRVVLETAPVLREAIALYTAHGFRPYDAPRVSERCDRRYALDL